ncbi:MAG: DUF4301 family protein, partial [Bacteroidales bacterium]|nr:DUF4301 family protein [Bacteroidales bacterium]
MFTEKDLDQLTTKNISIETIEKQLSYFRSGFPFLQIDKAATVNDGIQKFTEEIIDLFEENFEKNRKERKILKFVPASGAATRMFKELYEFISSPDDQENPSVKEVFDRLTDFAFYQELKSILEEKHIPIHHKKNVAEAILLKDGLNYGNLPKGLLLFHKYPDGPRTAMEEHLVEGAEYTRNTDKNIHLHFTVSSEHQDDFEKLVRERIKKYMELFNVSFDITFSQQKPSTDTIAVDKNNLPMRNHDGSLLFRPGGHGALLDNLNELDGDIIFIKNIDNVVPDRLKRTTIRYKKALAGLLLDLQEKVFQYIHILNESLDRTTITEIVAFLKQSLSFQVPDAFTEWDMEKQKEYLLNTLNRPIRVCGMVRNEGEPGGGPFWVHNVDHSVSLQIAESSQINMNDPQQQSIAANATHFNPVDLVCAVKDHHGHRF